MIQHFSKLSKQVMAAVLLLLQPDSLLRQLVAEDLLFHLLRWAARLLQELKMED
jgi:hypothetical protein